MSFDLYPPPQKIRTQDSSFSLGGRRWIVLPAGVPDRLVSAAIRFANEISQPASITHGEVPAKETLVSLTVTQAANPEGYEMTGSDNGITLSGGEAGLFFGLGTLAQMLAQSEGSLPVFRIQDEPDFGRRGVMLDISRCKVPKMETLYDLVDRFAALKYNELQLYTEHTFAFRNHPIIWADASPMTPADIVALRDYCAARFIELVPNLNSFGHFERWLRHPEYRDYAECPDGFTHPLTGHHIDTGSTLKPAPESLELLASLYDEYLPLFKAGAFNIGGDEPWELGQGWSKRLCEEQGTTHVYVSFLAEIQKLVGARQRQMMFWSDIVLKDPGCLDALDRDVTALNWGYEADHPFARECEVMAQSGLPYYVCPGTSAWNSLTGRTANMLGNIASAARNGLKFNAAGLLITDWGDHGHHQYLPVSYPGFLMGACHAWNHESSRKLDPADGVNQIFVQDGTGITGELITELGKVHELASAKVRNATLFNRLLFWQIGHEPGAAADVTDAELTRCLDAFADLRARTPSLAASNGERELIQGELENAIDMAMHGIRRLQRFRGGSLSRTSLRAELMAIIGRHEALWLTRNRPGGLRESVGHLSRSLQAISDT